MLEIASILTGLTRPFRRRTPPGASPGTVVSEPTAPPTEIRVIAYGPEQILEEDVDRPARLSEYVGRYPVTWVNVEGLRDAGTIQEIGRIFGLHPLALEDVVNVHQRAKVEEFSDHLFIVARMVWPDEQLESEQISIFLGQNYVVTFQEGRPGDCLEPVRERLRAARGHHRSLGADYLAYSILDATVDGYFPVVERFGDRLDEIDDEITARPEPAVIAELHRLRGDLLLLRRYVWPHREAVGVLLRESTRQISSETKIYLRDVYDHAVQIIDVVEVYREICADLREFYFSTLSHRTNETMKTLTVIATIFMPLSFVAGVYGMNFARMPELEWRYGYPFALGLMGTVAVGLLVYIWRRGWFES